MRVSMRDHIQCTCGGTGTDLIIIQACPIVYECQQCTQCIEVSCGNIDCVDCADTYPAEKEECEG